MIAGGTGITPMYQVCRTLIQILQAADKNKDISSFYLVFANRTPDDILLKTELENFVSKKNFSFKLFFSVDRVSFINYQNWPNTWSGGRGFITEDMLLQNLPKPDENTLILTCGPPILTKNHLLPILNKIGYVNDNIFDF